MLFNSVNFHAFEQNMKTIAQKYFQFFTAAKLLFFVLALSQLSACALAVVGAAGGAIVANDRRQASVILEDERIEVAANDKIYSDPALSKKIHANVTCYNHTILLTGEVVSEELRKHVVDIVSNIEKVKLVHNELVVANLADFSERSGDTWLTSKVKTRMLASEYLDGSHVKVVSENSSVYLMGIVTPDEAKIAANIASQTKGVERVVTLFEVIDPATIEQKKIESPKLQKI